MSLHFNTNLLRGTVEPTANPNVLVVSGEVLKATNLKKISYVASAPMERHFSFSGSGLPFANAEQAFEDTPNRGEVQLNGSGFKFHLLRPNSYYVSLGSALIDPTVYITIDNEVAEVKVGESQPYRTLTYANGQNSIARRDASFYQRQGPLLPVRTQESILRSGDYGKETHKNYWGDKPPL